MQTRLALLVAAAAALASLHPTDARAEGAPGEDPPEGRRVHGLRWMVFSGTKAVRSLPSVGPGVNRVGLGRYEVTFPGPEPNGNVQLSGYGGTPGTCNVGGWSAGAQDTTIDVRCYDGDGRPQDMGFALLHVIARDDPPNAALAYGWLAAPTSSSPTAAYPMAYRSPGLPAPPRRVAPGTYHVVGRAGVGWGSQSVWFATGYGPTPRGCRGVSNPSFLGFQCPRLDASRTAADSMASFLVLHRSTLSPWAWPLRGAGGYARFLGSGAPWGTVGTGRYDWMSNGGTIRATRERAGRYEVRFPGVGDVKKEPGFALVSEGCREVAMQDAGPDVVVAIDCGVDRDFDVAFVRMGV